MLHDVAHKRWIMELWCGVVVVVVVVDVVEVVRWCWISCWVHAYSYKVGGSCPVECLIIHTTLIWEPMLYTLNSEPMLWHVDWYHMHTA